MTIMLAKLRSGGTDEAVNKKRAYKCAATKNSNNKNGWPKKNAITENETTVLTTEKCVFVCMFVHFLTD